MAETMQNPECEGCWKLLHSSVVASEWYHHIMSLQKILMQCTAMSVWYGSWLAERSPTSPTIRFNQQFSIIHSLSPFKATLQALRTYHSQIRNCVDHFFLLSVRCFSANTITFSSTGSPLRFRTAFMYRRLLVIRVSLLPEMHHLFLCCRHPKWIHVQHLQYIITKISDAYTINLSRKSQSICEILLL